MVVAAVATEEAVAELAPWHRPLPGAAPQCGMLCWDVNGNYTHGLRATAESSSCSPPPISNYECV